jgi:ribosomal protein L44E
MERQSKNQTDAVTRTELMQKARQYIQDWRQQKQYPSAHKVVIEEIQKKKKKINLIFRRIASCASQTV